MSHGLACATLVTGTVWLYQKMFLQIGCLPQRIAAPHKPAQTRQDRAPPGVGCKVRLGVRADVGVEDDNLDLRPPLRGQAQVRDRVARLQGSSRSLCTVLGIHAHPTVAWPCWQAVAWRVQKSRTASMGLPHGCSGRGAGSQLRHAVVPLQALGVEAGSAPEGAPVTVPVLSKAAWVAASAAHSAAHLQVEECELGGLHVEALQVVGAVQVQGLAAGQVEPVMLAPVHVAQPPQFGGMHLLQLGAS